MNTKLFLPLALALPMFASCDEAADAADGARNAIENLDLSDMTPDAIKSKASEVMGNLGEALEGIKDEAGASKIAKEWLPELTDLAAMKEKLGDAMPSMDSLEGIVETVKTRFSDNAGIMDALEPLMEKLQSLMG